MCYLGIVLSLIVVFSFQTRMEVERLYRMCPNWVSSGSSNTFVTLPVIAVSQATIDAELGTEFSLTVSSNTALGIINMRDGRAVNLTVTYPAIRFTNAVDWAGKSKPSDTEDIKMFHFYKIGEVLHGAYEQRIPFPYRTAANQPTVTDIVTGKYWRWTGTNWVEIAPADLRPEWVH